MQLHKNIPLIGSYYFLFLCAILGLQISTQIASIFKSTKQVHKTLTYTITVVNILILKLYQKQTARVTQSMVNIHCHRNIWGLMLLNQWVALTML